MNSDNKAANGVVAPNGGKGKSISEASIPIFDYTTQLRNRQAQRTFFAIMKAALNDHTCFISFAALSSILLIPEREISRIANAIDGCIVVVARRV